VSIAGGQPLQYPRFWLAGGWLLIVLAVAVSVLPGLPTFTVRYSDKVFHAFMYFVLMIWFAGLYLPSRYGLIALGLASLGVGLEFLQTLFPYRFFDPWDIAANISGIAIAWLSALGGMSAWCRMVEKRVVGSVDQNNS